MPEPQKNTVIVTGSSGLIGSSVCSTLGERFDVVGFDKDGPSSPPAAAEFICVDLTSDQSVAAAFERVRFGYGTNIASVIHLAAHYDFSGKPSPLYEKLTVQGTARLLRALKEFEVGQIIFASTMLVHAPCEPGEKITEGWPLLPKWEYPKSKVAAENLLRAEHGETPLVIMRLAGVYDRLTHCIPLAQQMQRIYERRLTSRVYPGDPSRGQPFVHLDDVVDAIDRAVIRRESLPHDLTLLIGEEHTPSYGELQERFGELIHDSSWNTRRIPKALAKTGAWLDPFIKPWMIDLADDHQELDVSLAKKSLGWHPRYSLREYLPELVRELKADEDRWYKENNLKQRRKRHLTKAQAQKKAA